MGNSGSGKSCSIRTFKKGEVVVFEVAGKPLPFKADWTSKYVLSLSKDKYSTSVIDDGKNEDEKADKNQSILSRYDQIKKLITKIDKQGKIKSIVIDDAQYLMAFENFANANVVGYGKYTNMAVHYQNLLSFCVNETADDVIIYFLTHTSKDDDGHQHIKTLGKMLDNQLTVDGLFTTLLLAVKENGEYYFQTNDNDNMSTAKSPMGMFSENLIPNDLALVDRTIREYYGIETNKKGETK